MCLLDLFWRIGEDGKMHVWGFFCWEVGSNVDEVTIASKRKKNILINNSVGLSICDCPIETVKYVWLNI